MAVVETIKIEGDASEFNEALKDLNTRIESLEKQLSRANTEIKEFGDKGEKSIKGVRQEVKETGKSIKDLIKNLGGLAIINKVCRMQHLKLLREIKK
jgi:phage-related minor tail protein